MRIAISMLVLLLASLGAAEVEPKLDEATVRSVVEEITEAFWQQDIDVIKSYLYPGTEFILDLDPSGDSPPVEVEYEPYLFMLEVAMGAVEESNFRHQIVGIEVDSALNLGVVKEEAVTVAELMGVRVEEETHSETTYGIVNGEIKVLRIQSRVIQLNVEE